MFFHGLVKAFRRSFKGSWEALVPPMRPRTRPFQGPLCFLSLGSLCFLEPGEEQEGFPGRSQREGKDDQGEIKQLGENTLSVLRLPGLLGLPSCSSVVSLQAIQVMGRLTGLQIWAATAARPRSQAAQRCFNI